MNEPTTVPDSIDELLEMTSLGSPEAHRHRRNTPPAIEHNVLALLAAITPRSVEVDGNLAISSKPTTQAVHCPYGHPNPPYGDSCRQCGAAIPDRTVTTVPRPSLGHLRFADGSTIGLAQPVVLGRRPHEPATVGGEPARAVRLPDPDMALSRTHIEVRLVDWQVQIVDCNSMNHTFVDVPGQLPVRLRPHEPFPIPSGTAVTLGGAVNFTYNTANQTADVGHRHQT